MSAILHFTFYILHFRAAGRAGAGSLPCHPERSGEGTAKAAQSNGSLTLAPLSFRPREEAAATDRVEKSCAVRIGDKLFYRVRNG